MNTSMSMPNLLFAGKLRTQAALAANRSNTFMAALIAGADKQAGPMPWANQAPADEAGNEVHFIEILAKMALENEARAAKIVAEAIPVREVTAQTSVLDEWRSAEAAPSTHCRKHMPSHHRRSVAGQHRPDRSRSHRRPLHGWYDGSGTSASAGISQSPSAFPSAGAFRAQTALGSNQNNTFMAALLSSTERQSRQKPWSNPAAANQALATEIQPDRAFANQTLAEEAVAGPRLAVEPVASPASTQTPTPILTPILTPTPTLTPTPALTPTRALAPTPACPIIANEEVPAEETVVNLIPAEDVVAQTRVIPPPPRKQTNLLFRAWSWLNRNCSISSNKQLRVAETISLGDKRFVAVVQVEGRKFLIGGGSAGVSLLTQLGTANDTQAAFGAAMASGVIPE